MSETSSGDSQRAVFACIAVVFGFGIAICAPLWHSYWFPSHEMGRYLLRVLEFVRDWKDGHPIPRWAPDFYGGYGAATFVIFAPGVVALGGFPMLFGVDLATSMKLAIALYSVAGSLGTFFLVRGETRRADAALVAALAFTFVPYRFVDLYIRGDLAEYGALCLVPLVLWLYRELDHAPENRLTRFGFAAAVAHAALILSHTITGQWATEIVFVVLVFTFVRRVRTDRYRVSVVAAAFVGSLGLAAFYLIPALREAKYLHVEILTTDYFFPTRHMVSLNQYFKFGYYAFVGDDPAGTPNRVRMPFTIGIPLAAAMVAALASLVSASSRARMRASRLWWALTVAILVLMMPVSAKMWRILPFGVKIQFPWRLLALVATVGSAAIGTTWVALVPSTWRWRRWKWMVAAIAVVLIAWNGWTFVRVGDVSYPLAPVEPGMTAESIARWIETASSGEHLPRAVPEVPDHPRDWLVRTVSGVASASAVQRNGTTYGIAVDAEGPSAVDLAVFDFPGWRATLDSGPGAVVKSTSPKGFIRLTVPVAGHYQVHVDFHDTPTRTTGWIISLVFLFGLYPGLRWMHRLSLDRNFGDAPRNSPPRNSR